MSDDTIVELEESFGICSMARKRHSKCPNKNKPVILGAGYCMECYDTKTETRKFKGVSGV